MTLVFFNKMWLKVIFSEQLLKDLKKKSQYDIVTSNSKGSPVYQILLAVCSSLYTGCQHNHASSFLMKDKAHFIRFGSQTEEWISYLNLMHTFHYIWCNWFILTEINTWSLC